MEHMDRKMYLQNRRKALKAAIDEGRNIREVTDYVHREFMEDDKVVIHVNVDELYDPLCTERFRQLNGDIFEYVEECAKLTPVFVPLKVILFGVDEEDRKVVHELFRLHYRIELQDGIWNQRLNLTKMIVMGVIGVIAIMAFLYFALRQDDNLFLELLSVVGSFSLWEVANCFLLERRTINWTLYKTAQFLTAEIVFDE